MVTREDFTTDEWITLRALMQSAFFGVAVADRLLYDEEAETWGRLRPHTIPLVQALIGKSEDAAEHEAVLERATDTDLETLVEESHVILQAKVTREEIEELRLTLQALAHGVAEADDHVAEKESEFLETLDALLQGWDA